MAWPGSENYKIGRCLLNITVELDFIIPHHTGFNSNLHKILVDNVNKAIVSIDK